MEAELEQRPFLAWPGAELLRTLPLCALFAVLFLVSFTATSWLAGLHKTLPAWDLPFENDIPFVPSFSLLYLTITPVLMLAPFIFRTRSTLWPLFGALTFETVIASLFFLVVPQTTKLTQPLASGWIHLPLLAARTAGLDFNQFPSLHVAFACTAAWAYSRRAKTFGRIVLAIWTLAVVSSTWLIHEHNLIDILGGLLLATLVLRFVYPWLQSPSTKEAFWVELCCLQQCFHFSRRHRRYVVIFLGIYFPSLLHWRCYRVVRVAFSTAQWIDDLLDGDRRCDGEPLEVVEELVVEMKARTFSSHPLPRLTRELFNELDQFRTERRDPHEDFIALVGAMERDRVRVLGGEVWDAQELDEHHRRTFSLSIDLMLLTSGCSARADEVPGLIDALAWCSTFRDLEDDLSKGLINVPRDIWFAVRESGSGSAFAALTRSSRFREWSREEYQSAVGALSRSEREIGELTDSRARSILGGFHSSVVKFARRLHKGWN